MILWLSIWYKSLWKTTMGNGEYAVNDYIREKP